MVNQHGRSRGIYDILAGGAQHIPGSLTEQTLLCVNTSLATHCFKEAEE